MSQAYEHSVGKGIRYEITYRDAKGWCDVRPAMWLAKGFPWWFHLILTNFLIHGLSYHHFTEKDTEAGSGLGLSLHGTSWRQSPEVEPPGHDQCCHGDGAQPDSGWKCGSRRQFCGPLVFLFPERLSRQHSPGWLTRPLPPSCFIMASVIPVKLDSSPSLNYDIIWSSLTSWPLGLDFQNSPTTGNSIPIKEYCAVLSRSVVSNSSWPHGL